MIYLKNFYSSFIIFSLVLLSIGVLTAQNTDSLKHIPLKAGEDSNRVKVLHQIYTVDNSVTHPVEALYISERIGYKPGIAQSLLDIGRYYYFDGKPDVSLGYLIKAIKIGEELNNKKLLINAYRYTGYIYRPDDPYMAADYYNKALKLTEETKDEISESYVLSALGNVYEKIYEGNSDDNRKALQYYLRSLTIRERIGTNDEIASSLNETSRVYDVIGQRDKGLELRLKGLQVAEQSGSTKNIVYLNNVLGNEYSRMHDYKKSLDYDLTAYTIAKQQKIHIAEDMATLYDITKGMAYDYRELGDLKKADAFYAEAIDLNDSIRSLGTKHDYNLSGLKHDLEKELEKEKLLLKDAEISKGKAEAARQTILRNELFVVFGFILLIALIIFRGYRVNRLSNRKLAIKNKQLENAYQVLAESENKFKLITETINDVFYLFNIVEKKYEYISPNCITLFGLSQEWVYENNTTKSVVHPDDLALVKEANTKVDTGNAYEIEFRVVVNDEIKWVAEKSSPIYDEKGKLIRNSGICRNITLRKTNEEIIASKNKDIRDSILYASTIQNAILVPKSEIAKKLNDFFILSKPKDIVSGDFYFYRETDEGLVVAVADCTGHGVPGGFMSMLGNAYLNDIINNNKDIAPAEILKKLGKRIVLSLNQDTSYTSNKDGMDIALIKFNNNNTSLQYAGSNNSLYIVRKGELMEIPADKLPIGINYTAEQTEFTNNKVEIQKGDALYLFSDGYADQYGGPNIKKFTKKQLQKTLLSVSDKSMAEQERILNEAFENWKSEQMQIDDVMIMGIRI